MFKYTQIRDAYKLRDTNAIYILYTNRMNGVVDFDVIRNAKAPKSIFNTYAIKSI